MKSFMEFVSLIPRLGNLIQEISDIKWTNG